MIITMNYYPRNEKMRSVAYTMALSVVELPRKSQYPFLWVGLTRRATPAKRQG